MVPYNPQQNGRVERLHGIHIRNADATTNSGKMPLLSLTTFTTDFHIKESITRSHMNFYTIKGSIIVSSEFLVELLTSMSLNNSKKNY